LEPKNEVLLVFANKIKLASALTLAVAALVSVAAPADAHPPLRPPIVNRAAIDRLSAELKREARAFDATVDAARDFPLLRREACDIERQADCLHDLTCRATPKPRLLAELRGLENKVREAEQTLLRIQREGRIAPVTARRIATELAGLRGVMFRLERAIC
jgi:hypothetical protein